MRVLVWFMRFYYENRRSQRVLETLRLEAKRLRLDRDNRELAKYVDGLADYLEGA